MIKNIFITSILLLGILVNNAFSQSDDLEYINHVYKDNIHTVLFYQDGWEFSYPIIELNGESQLKLEFDDLDSDIENYSYTLYHCTADWKSSELNQIEYIDGFTENTIGDYSQSFSTMVSYNHYSLNIPNDDVRPLISGNYLLVVYRNYDTEDLVLTRRFSVTDTRLSLTGKVDRSRLVQNMDAGQDITFEISGETLIDPTLNLKVAIYQNGRTDNCIIGPKPDFISGNVLQYTNSRELFFLGGSEFKYFNSKNTTYRSEKVRTIGYQKPYYFFGIEPDRVDAYLPYSFHNDINGERKIALDNSEDPAVEADYVYVDFTLKKENPLNVGDYYVFGGLTDWQILPRAKMQYNAGTNAYEARLLLKQGYYNYTYAFAETENSAADVAQVNGSYYQTENNYLILTYYHEPSSNYDELIGMLIVNSQKKL